MRARAGAKLRSARWPSELLVDWNWRHGPEPSGSGPSPRQQRRTARGPRAHRGKLAVTLPVFRWQVGRRMVQQRGIEACAQGMSRAPNPWRICSGGLSAATDEVRQIWDDWLVWDGEAVAEVIPERHAKHGSGSHQSKAASGQSRPSILRVPPLIFRLVTWSRMSRSEPLVWSGISGRSSTINSSGLLACSRASRRSSVTKPVRRWTIRSKRAHFGPAPRLWGQHDMP
jgi:hypothetical protein